MCIRSTATARISIGASTIGRPTSYSYFLFRCSPDVVCAHTYELLLRRTKVQVVMFTPRNHHRPCMLFHSHRSMMLPRCPRPKTELPEGLPWLTASPSA